MTSADVADLTLEFLKRIQAEQAAQRQDIRAIQQSFIDMARVVQRLDARLSDIKSDLETMFKMEIIGQFAHFETRFETRLDQLLDHKLDQKLAPVLERLEQLVAR